MGCADALPRPTRLPRDRARPPGSWALHPDVGLQRLRHLGRRPGGPDRAARPGQSHSDRPLDGRGEIARYVGRYGTSRLAKMVFIGAVPPLMLKTDNNPGGLPLSVFDGLRSGLVENRSQFYRDTSVAFFGYNRPNAKVSEAVEDQFWRLGMQSGVKASYDCIEQFSETDFTEDLKKVDVPTLFMHGEDDQIVPYGDASVLAAKLAQNGVLKIYPGLSHGMTIVDAETINADLRAFIRS